MDDDDYGYDSDSAYQESGRRFRRGRNSDGELSDEDDNSDDGYGYGRRSGSQKGGRKSGSRGNTGDDDSRAGQGIGLNDTLNIGNYQQLIDSNNNDWVNVLGEEKKYKMVQTTAFGK